MVKKRKKKLFSGIKLVAVALGLCLLLMVLGLRYGEHLGPAATVFSSLQGSVQQAGQFVRQNAAHIYGEAAKYEALLQENETLRDELAALRTEQREAKAAIRENERLYALLSLRKTRQDLTLEPARVLSTERSNWGRSIVIDRGTAADVAVGDCVIDARGALVGLVTARSAQRATVQLVIDAAFTLGGECAGSGEAGILTGSLDDMQNGTLQLTHLRKDGGVAAGEEVVTFASQGVYPHGLLVGTVEELSLDPSGLQQNAVLRPAAELEELVQVFVVTDFTLTTVGK